jgi:predicted enzyme related to lactoylglutathione lyase
MHKSRLGTLIIDCRTEDLPKQAKFWSEALGLAIKPLKPDESGKYITLVTPEGIPTIQLQKVDHDSRVHLDIETDDIAAEVARLEKLGAKRVQDLPRWVVMEAPSGHRFCVVKPQRKDFPGDATSWG